MKKANIQTILNEKENMKIKYDDNPEPKRKYENNIYEENSEQERKFEKNKFEKNPEPKKENGKKDT